MVKWLAAVVAVLVLGASALAAEGGGKEEEKTKRVRGVVKEVKVDEGKEDSGSVVVTVKKGDKDEDMTFVVNSDTQFKGEEGLNLKKLKVGAKVRVDYKEVEGKNVAVKIRDESKE